MSPNSDVLAAYPKAIAAGPWEYLPESGGFSGARLWRSPAGWRLKATPSAAIGHPLPEIHAWMRHASTLDFVPRVATTSSGSTIIDTGAWRWDIVSWLPGEPLLRDPTPARLAAAGRALALIHLAWQSSQPRTGTCPAIERRILALERFVPGTSRRDLLVRRLSVQSLAQLAVWKNRTFRLQPCLCDIWTDHVLFEGDRVAGLIDFGSAKIDHPAVDLARLLGDCLGGEPLRWQPLLDAYHTIRPLNPTDHALIATLEATGAVVALLTWIERERGRPLTPAEAARSAKVLARCERLETAL